MTSRNYWKTVERKVSRFFGSERNPLSGGNSKHTRSDSLDKELFIETKYRKKWAILTLLKETIPLAKKENKIPIIVVKQSKQEGFAILIKDEYIAKFVEIMQRKYNDR